jgi:hypothetical protein
MTTGRLVGGSECAQRGGQCLARYHETPIYHVVIKASDLHAMAHTDVSVIR